MPGAGIYSKRPGDVLWWIIAGTLCWTVVRVPDLMYPGQLGDYQLVFYGILLVAGVVLGTCRPEQPWRWAFAGFLALALGDLGALGAFHLSQLNTINVWMHVRAGVGGWALHALPILVGAYVGSSMVAPSL
jgi:hypothetical protein